MNIDAAVPLTAMTFWVALALTAASLVPALLLSRSGRAVRQPASR
jgi:hypothetical protein